MLLHVAGMIQKGGGEDWKAHPHNSITWIMWPKHGGRYLWKSCSTSSEMEVAASTSGECLRARALIAAFRALGSCSSFRASCRSPWNLLHACERNETVGWWRGAGATPGRHPLSEGFRAPEYHLRVSYMKCTHTQARSCGLLKLKFSSAL